MTRISFDILLCFLVATLIFVGININPHTFVNKDQSSLHIIINYIRFFTPIFSVSFLWLYISKNKNVLSYNKLSLYNYMLISCYLLVFISSLFVIKDIENMYFFLYIPIFIFIFLITKYFNTENLYKTLLYVITFYIVVTTALWLIHSIITSPNIYYFMDQMLNLRSLSYFQFNTKFFLGQAAVRSTGYARIVVLLWIILLYFQYTKINISKYNNFFIFFLSLILISLQSKFSLIVSIIVFLTFLLFLKTNKKKIINIFLYTLILPLLIYFLSLKTYDYFAETYPDKIKTRYHKFLVQLDVGSTEGSKLAEKINLNKLLPAQENDLFEDTNYKDNLETKKYLKIVDEAIKLIDRGTLNEVEIKQALTLKKLKKLLETGKIDGRQFENEVGNLLDFKNVSKFNKITTGRTAIWERQLNFIKDNNIILIGKGVISDLKFFNVTSSNAFIYSWLSGGLFCAAIYLILILILGINFLLFLIKNFRTGIVDYRMLFYTIASVLVLRTFIENGFMSINLDLFIILLTFELLKKNNSLYLSNLELHSSPKITEQEY